jgi:hypothetical protein
MLMLQVWRLKQCQHRLKQVNDAPDWSRTPNRGLSFLNLLRFIAHNELWNENIAHGHVTLGEPSCYASENHVGSTHPTKSIPRRALSGSSPHFAYLCYCNGIAASILIPNNVPHGI